MKVLARIAVLAAVTPLVIAATPPAERLHVTGETIVDDGADVPELPDIDAAAWLVADLETGAVLAARDAHVPLPPASTIKMLTAIALLADVDPDIAYEATPDDANIEGSRVGLVPEETYSKADLAHGLLLASGNDAAHAIAEITGGQFEAVDAMNAEAARLGAFRTPRHHTGRTSLARSPPRTILRCSPGQRWRTTPWPSWFRLVRTNSPAWTASRSRSRARTACSARTTARSA